MQAGRLLLDLRSAGNCTGKSLGDLGDREANSLILAGLREERPADFVLSEESRDDPRRCGGSRVWIVDPLDGTREYASGRDDWAVHVALAVDGRPFEGAVAVPARDRVYSTDLAMPVPVKRSTRPRLIVSRSRCPDLALHVAERIGADTLTMGSAGAKAMAVVDGDADIYLHEGGQYEWDNCAPAAVAMAAGLHASRVDGSPLIYNCADPLLPDLLICRRELAASVLQTIASLR